MAQKVQVVLVDDLDGGPADETVTFSLDGVAYEIDLSAGHAATLRDSLATYVGHARKVSGATRRTGRRAAAQPGAGKPGEVRDWARSQGIEVSERGRISSDVMAKFQAAHP